MAAAIGATEAEGIPNLVLLGTPNSDPDHPLRFILGTWGAQERYPILPRLMVTLVACFGIDVESRAIGS